MLTGNATLGCGIGSKTLAFCVALVFAIASVAVAQPTPCPCANGNLGASNNGVLGGDQDPCEDPSDPGWDPIEVSFECETSGQEYGIGIMGWTTCPYCVIEGDVVVELEDASTNGESSPLFEQSVGTNWEPVTHMQDTFPVAIRATGLARQLAEAGTPDGVVGRLKITVIPYPGDEETEPEVLTQTIVILGKALSGISTRSPSNGSCPTCAQSESNAYPQGPTPTLRYFPDGAYGPLEFQAASGWSMARGGVLKYSEFHFGFASLYVPGAGNTSSGLLDEMPGRWDYQDDWYGSNPNWKLYNATVTTGDGLRYAFISSNGAAVDDDDWHGAVMAPTELRNPDGTIRATFESECIPGESCEDMPDMRVTKQVSTNGLAALLYEYDAQHPDRLVRVVVDADNDGTGDGASLELEYDEHYRLLSYSYSGCSACGEGETFTYAAFDPNSPNQAQILSRTTGDEDDELTYTYDYNTNGTLEEVTRSWTDGAQNESQVVWRVVDSSGVPEYRSYVNTTDYELTRIESQDGAQTLSRFTGLNGTGTHLRERRYAEEACDGQYDCHVITDPCEGDECTTGQHLYFRASEGKLSKEVRWDGEGEAMASQYDYSYVMGSYPVTNVWNPYGGVTTTHYDDTTGHVDWHTDPSFGDFGGITGKQNEVKYTYTNNDQLDTQKRKIGEHDWVTTDYDYNANGLLEWVIEDVGNNAFTTHYAYDAYGNVATITDSRGVQQWFDYTPTGVLKRQYTLDWDPQAGAGTLAVEGVKYYHDSHGRLVLERRIRSDEPFDPGSMAGAGAGLTWQNTAYLYDHFGRRTHVIENPDIVLDGDDATVSAGTNSRVTQYEYDWQDRVTRTIRPDGSWTRLVRDGRGLVTDEIVGHDTTEVLRTTYGYDAAGRRTQVTAPSGRVTQYEYDGFGRLKKVVEGDAYTEYVYDELHGQSHGQPTEIWQQATDASTNGVTMRSYDPLGRVWREARAIRTGFDTQQPDPEDMAVTLTVYGIPGHVEKTVEKTSDAYDGISENDRVTVREYDDLGRLEATQIQVGTTTTPLARTEYVYDEGGNVTEQHVLREGTDYLVSTTEHDALGRSKRVTDPEGHYRVMMYDSRGHQIGETAYEDGEQGDVAAARRGWVYDELGQLESETTYAEAATGGTPDRMADRVVDYTYDDGGRVETIRTYNMNSSTPLTTTYTYDDIGRRTGVADPNGNTQTWIYATEGDDIGLVIERQVADGLGTRVFTLEYDDRDRLTVDTAEGDGQLGSVNLVTQYGYNDFGQRTSVTDPKGQVTQYEYDWLGRQIRMTEAAETGGLARVTDSIYDRLGRLEGLVAYEGTAPANAPASMEDVGTNGTPQLTRYAYDLAGRRTRIVYPDADQEIEPENCTDCIRMDYDLAGRMITRTEQRPIGAGRLTVTYAYDDRGLLLSRETNETPATVDTFAYDGLGRMTEAVRDVGQDEQSRSTFAYDDLSGLVAETQSIRGGPTRLLSYDNDQAGNRLKLAYPDPAALTLGYSYDVLNRVDNVYRGGPGGSVLVDYSYDGLYLDTRAVRTTASSETWIDTAYGWDEHRRNDAITNSKDTGSPTTLVNFAYTFDLAGNRATTTATAAGFAPLNQGITYGYDSLHRLTTASYGPSAQESFNYDLLGNRDGVGPTYGYTDTRTNPATTVAYAANNPANEYTAINGQTVTHDEAGNLTEDEDDLTYAYDFENRLVKITGLQEPTIIRVDARSTAQNPDGESWATSYPYLQTALGAAADAAESGPVEVWVAGCDDEVCTYYPDDDWQGGGSTRLATFELHDNVAVLGGFQGGLPSDPYNPTRDPAVYITILSGDLDQNDCGMAVGQPFGWSGLLARAAGGWVGPWAELGAQGVVIWASRPFETAFEGMVKALLPAWPVAEAAPTAPRKAAIKAAAETTTEQHKTAPTTPIDGPDVASLPLQAHLASYTPGIQPVFLAALTQTAGTNGLPEDSGSNALGPWAQAQSEGQDADDAADSPEAGALGGESFGLLDGGGALMGYAESCCPDNKTNNAYHVVTADGVGPTAILDGVTIKNGYANGDAPNHHIGGGIRCDNAAGPTIRHCIIECNAAVNGGGIMARYDAAPTITQCIIRYNTSVPSEAQQTPNGGGGMANYQAGSVLTDCTFVSNSSLGTAGAGMQIGESSPNLIRCTFQANEAPNQGGGVTVWGSTAAPQLIGCTFESNTALNALGTYGLGAGVAVINGAKPTLRDCTFTDNEAARYGGGVGVTASTSQAKLVQCSFTGNEAPSGGGLSVQSGQATAVNCRFLGNHGQFGGGIFVQSSTGTASLTNCVFSGNTADGRLESLGGGLCVVGSGSATVTNCTLYGNASVAGDVALGGGVYVESATANVRNAIVWDNSTTWGSGETAQIYTWSPVSFSLSYSCVEGWTSGGLGGYWNTAADPAFVDPDGQDNVLGTEDDDVRLTSGSSAIDTASDAAVPDDDYDLNRNGDAQEPLPLDLARGDRFLGTGPTVDMGAYEYLNPGDGLGDPEPPAAGAPGPEPSGTAYIAFAYDSLGRRIERIVDSGGASVEVTRYYYEGQNVVREVDADEAPRRSFVHGSQYVDERVLMRLPTGKEYYYLPRELYSVAALTDETGTIVEAATYDTYGKVAVYDGSAQTVAESPVGNPYYFTGRRLDLLALADGLKQVYHYRAREYNPGNGRFMQRDPLFIPDDEAARLHGSKLLPRSAQLPTEGIGTLATAANERNPYAYVVSNPLGGVDPEGLDPYDQGICESLASRNCDTCWQTCQQNQGLFPPGAYGLVICRQDHCKCACINETELPPSGQPGMEIARSCAIAHEEYHVRSPRVRCSCRPKPCPATVLLSNQKDEECFAYAEEINCLCENKPKCGDNDNCIDLINSRIENAERQCAKLGGDIYKHGATKCREDSATRR